MHLTHEALGHRTSLKFESPLKLASDGNALSEAKLYQPRTCANKSSASAATVYSLMSRISLCMLQYIVRT